MNDSQEKDVHFMTLRYAVKEKKKQEADEKRKKLEEAMTKSEKKTCKELIEHIVRKLEDEIKKSPVDDFKKISIPFGLRGRDYSKDMMRYMDFMLPLYGVHMEFDFIYCMPQHEDKIRDILKTNDIIVFAKLMQKLH